MAKFSIEELSAALGSACVEAGIPGASASWLTREGRVDAVFGVTSTASVNPVSGATVFQIGSITKVYTSYLAVKFAEQGLWSLDESIAQRLPELLDLIPEAREITIARLISHTSGIDGDVWIDSGRGDECLERYLQQFPPTQMLHPAGACFSYCNSGFILVGLAMSRMTGMTWEALIGREVVEQFGLLHTAALPEQAILHGAAVGHLLNEGQLVASEVWQEPRSCGPAGTLSASAADLVRFAESLRAASDEFARMTEPVVVVPGSGVPSWYGLGWRTWDAGVRVVGHDGKSRGQATYLRLVPERGEILALMFNRSDADLAAHLLFSEVLGESVGATVAGLRAPSETRRADDSILGNYRRNGGEVQLKVRDDEIVAFHTTVGPFYRGGATLPAEYTIRASTSDPGALVAVNADLPVLDVWHESGEDSERLFFGDRYYLKY